MNSSTINRASFYVKYRNIWFEAATAVAVAPAAEIQRESVLKSAFAGGLSCAFSSAVMHPVDTVKVHSVYVIRDFL